MKKNNLIEVLKMGSIAIPKLLLRHYRQLNLTSDEFIFIIYLLDNPNDIILDVEKIATDMGLENKDILNLVQTLKEKDMINVIVNKNDKRVVNEYISLESFYNKLSDIVIEYINSNKGKKDNGYIYETFEKEFGRTLSPMEYEIINAWIDSNINCELIIEALKEATFNGVANLRYIDKIIYEWNKKGFKTINDVKKYNSSRHDKKEKVEVFNYNWLEDDSNEE